MKTTTKIVLGAAVVIAVSAGAASVTTYAMMKPDQKKALAFDDIFQQNPDVRLAALNAGDLRPVDLTAAAESSVHAVVHIKSTQSAKKQNVVVNDPFYDFFGDIFGNRGGGQQQRQVETPERVGVGSGVIISRDGYIVTNNHVIDGADIISVRLNDGREFQGRIIGTDPSTDLALVKIEGKDLPTIPVGDSDKLKVGEWVLAVGNPFNMTSTVTAGIVSAKARSLGVYNNGVESFIQTDAAINQGNSGGALVNARGELVGINSVLYSPTGAYSGYGFAIPTTIMTNVIADLKEYGAVQRAILGVKGRAVNDEQQTMSDEMKTKVKNLGAIDGVLIREIIDGGSAAGQLKVDDVIIGIDDKKVKNFAELQEELAKHRPGDKIMVKVLRDKKEKDISLVLKNAQGNTKVVKVANMDILGAAFRELPDDMKKQLNLSNGIQVTGVTDGKMKDAGVRKGFIILKANGQVVNSVEDIQEIMKSATQSTDQVLFLSGVFASGKRANYAVDLTQE
ncbi:trypsin-like peptidase domain-containing protein [Phocaeicola paurosaccharolyticus]|jgi:Do/DeqQ family serine protease|uniref:trypsin-like peptidase domain-containing protein n=1 Tax=Phocaeicola paurosaccharolyticus TaxID=732242 RepID=UPI000469620E|nr:trypsin-like peptidase domain-containing protein [Phocaeicola paurosaccharolyticus]